GGLGDAELHVYQVVAAGHGLALDVDAAGLEEAQALQAHLGAVDRRLRVPGTLELAHLAAQDLVGGAGVALEHDAAHGDARARVALPVDRNRAVRAVGVGNHVDLGEGVAEVAQGGRDLVGAEPDQRAREGHLRLDEHQALDVFLRQHGVAGDFDAGYGVHLAL